MSRLPRHVRVWLLFVAFALAWVVSTLVALLIHACHRSGC